MQRAVDLSRAFGARARAALVARIDRIVAAIVGVLWFVAIADTAILDPRNLDHISGDAASVMIARDFAQWDGWHWPITRIDNYLAPLGTTTVWVGTNPWTTLATKLLLPRDIGPLQLIGLWLAAMFALQGWCGARLARHATDDLAVRVAAGVLFVLSPVLAHRLGHDTLCAHFVIIVLIESILRTDAPRRALVATACVLTFAAGLHPTLFAMSLPLAGLVVARHVDRTLPILARAAGVIVAPLVVWIAWGNVGSRVDPTSAGFGFFSANLLSLVDPLERGRSAFLPPLPHGFGQFEGMGYLGAGVLALAVTVVGLRATRRLPPGDAASARWRWGLVALGLALMVFALSNLVWLGDWKILDLSKLYAPFPTITGSFRSSGRFVWPLHYTIIALVVLAASRLPPPRARALIVGAVLVQLFDIHHVDVRAIFPDRATVTESAGWKLAGDYARLTIDPPDTYGSFVGCSKRGHPSYKLLARVAARERLIFNSGASSRYDPKQHEVCDAHRRAREEGQFAPDTIYAPGPDGEDAYKDRTTLTCGPIDGFPVCVRADRPTALRDLLADPRGPLLPLEGHPLLLGTDNIGPVENGTRFVSATSLLDLGRPGPGSAAWFSFRGRIAPGEIANRAATIRVLVDGKEMTRVRLAHETFGAVVRVPIAGERVRFSFVVEGTLSQAVFVNPTRLWEILRLEWFAAPR